MSESENAKVKRCLDQAAGIARNHIEVMENDKRQLLEDLDSRRNLYAELKKSEVFWRQQCEAEERKSSTTLLFMFLFGCMAAVAIAYAILNCQ